MQPARQQANPTLPTSLSLPGKGGFSASLWGFCRPEGSPAKAPHAGSLPCVERGCCSLPSARRPTGLVRTPAGILDAQHLTRLARDAHIWRLSAEISHPEGARGRGPGLPNPQRASRATLGWRCGRRGRSVTTARLEAVPLGGTGAQSFRQALAPGYFLGGTQGPFGRRCSRGTTVLQGQMPRSSQPRSWGRPGLDLPEVLSCDHGGS